MSAVSYETSGSTLTESERKRAADYLAETRNALLSAVAGLSDEQWRFRPAEGTWSILEIVEHVGDVERRVHSVIARLPEAAEAEPNQSAGHVEERIMTGIPQRSQKIQAPPQLCPSGQCTPAEALKRFVEAREESARLLETAPALRGRVFPHPVAGAWDGYQWILGGAAHSLRHTNQILEWKADPAFPKTGEPAGALQH